MFLVTHNKVNGQGVRSYILNCLDERSGSMGNLHGNLPVLISTSCLSQLFEVEIVYTARIHVTYPAHDNCHL